MSVKVTIKGDKEVKEVLVKKDRIIGRPDVIERF